MRGIIIFCVVAGASLPVFAAPQVSAEIKALSEDAHCMLDVLKTTSRIEDIRTRLSPRGYLEIEFGYDSSAGSLITSRFEVIRVRETDGFAYRDLEPHYIGTSGVMENLVNRWRDECRAVELPAGAP